jgi:hypothetical protein
MYSAAYSLSVTSRLDRATRQAADTRTVLIFAANTFFRDDYATFGQSSPFLDYGLVQRAPHSASRLPGPVRWDP